jgi:hypothetical protein
MWNVGDKIKTRTTCDTIFLLFFTLTKSMKQSLPRETNISRACQEILRIWWNLKDHYCLHNSSPIFPALSRIRFLGNTFYITLPPMPTSSNWSPAFRSPYQKLCPRHPPPYMPHACLSNSSWFGDLCNIWWGSQVMTLLTMQFLIIMIIIIIISSSSSSSTPPLHHWAVWCSDNCPSL